MIDTPQITQTAVQLTAVIHLTIPREEMRTVMGPGIRELMATLAAQGIAPARPCFTHHLRRDPATFDFEISVPDPTPVTAAGHMTPGRSTASKVARTGFHGGYGEIRAAWGELDDWIAAHGHTPGRDLWECHVADPESSPDPATWRTELNRPILG